MVRQTIAMYWNGTVGLFWGRMLPKVSILLKNASIKNCTKLNFQQKIQWVELFISPRVELWGTKDLPFLKCAEIGNYVHLAVNAAKSTD